MEFKSKPVDIEKAIADLEKIKSKGVKVILIDDYSSTYADIDNVELREVYHSDGEYLPDTEGLDDYETVRAAVISIAS